MESLNKETKVMRDKANELLQENENLRLQLFNFEKNRNIDTLLKTNESLKKEIERSKIVQSEIEKKTLKLQNKNLKDENKEFKKVIFFFLYYNTLNSLLFKKKKKAL